MISKIYAAAIETRNRLYEKGVLKAFPLGALTISIGNMTVGGTGKTPLVAFVAKFLAHNGRRTAVLSRGYGRVNSKQRVLVSDGERILARVAEAGDEPFELASELIGKAIVIADADRVAAATWARKKFGIDAFVLDDAFQHRRAQRDLDIVCVDATNPFGNEKTLPTGILREPLENLRRADAIVITRANLVSDVSELKAKIAKYNLSVPIFVSKNRVSSMIPLSNFTNEQSNSHINFDELVGNAQKCLAFCALGNPENFFEQLRREKFNLVATHRFADHHFYTQQDIEKLHKKALETDAKLLLTTAKDAVKLRDLKFELPCLMVKNDLIFRENDFREWLLGKI